MSKGQAGEGSRARPIPQQPTRPAQGPAPTIEYAIFALILTIAAYLRFSHRELLQFQSDETVAAHLALQFVRAGTLPLAGLMSSVGVTNPPLFIYLLIPLFAISSNPTFVCCCIAALGLAAVVVCWHVGRKYYSPIVGLAAAAMFAVSPWAIIHTRVIWAQDLVPLFSTLTIWALHAVVLGKKPKAIFWAVLLPLCVVQIHFSGLALSAAVLAALLVLRQRIDWRFAVAGLAVTAVVFAPYLKFQSQQNWADFRRAAQAVGSKNIQIPKGMTVHPEFGYRLPRREAWLHALAIMNAGNIEDVLGLSAAPRHDPYQIWLKTGRDHRYFEDSRTLGDGLLTGQRLWFVVALVFLIVQVAKTTKFSGRFPFLKRTDDPAVQCGWILVLWAVVPVLVFWGMGMWTYLTYYVILYPAHFLAAAVLLDRGMRMAAQPLFRLGLIAGLVVVVLANFIFMLDFYRFVGRYGGAHGTYGTAIGPKRAAARYVAARADVQRLIGAGRIVQMDQFGTAGQPQLEFPYLAVVDNPAATDAANTNLLVLVVDNNRSNFEPVSLERIAALAHLTGMQATNFGPMWLYFLQP